MNFYEDLKESLEQAVVTHNERQLAEEVKVAEQQLAEGKGVSNQEAREIIVTSISSKYK